MANFFKTSVAANALHAPATEAGSEPSQTFDGEALKAKAVALANKESGEMSEAIVRVMKAKEDWQGGPIAVLFAMKDTYGDDMETFPEPDSETGNNPDKFKLPVTDGNGKTAMRPTSFYIQFADATKEGAAIVQELEWLKRAGNAEAVKTGIPAEIIDMNPAQRTVRTDYLTGRRGTVRASYKKAMALYFQMQAVHALPHCAVDFVWQTDGEGNDTETVENTTKPIMVYVPPAEGKPVKEWEYFSIGSFLKLDAKVASEKGGTFKALKATVARQTGGATGNGKATETPAIKTVDTFVSRFVETFRFMDEMQSAKDAKDLGKLYQVLKAKGADELVVAFVEYRNYLDDIVDELGLAEKYTSITAALKKAEKAAA